MRDEGGACSCLPSNRPTGLIPTPAVPTALPHAPTPPRSDCLCPVVLTRGSDQMPVSTKFDMRNDPQVVRNYGACACGWVRVGARVCACRGGSEI